MASATVKSKAAVLLLLIRFLLLLPLWELVFVSSVVVHYCVSIWFCSRINVEDTLSSWYLVVVMWLLL